MGSPGEDPSCAASVVVASGVDDHASYMGESFAAKHLECALAPSSSKSLEAAAKERGRRTREGMERISCPI